MPARLTDVNTTAYDWMAVTLVCRLWREVALGTPKLWNYIYLGPLECIKLFLKRSCQVTLHIRTWEMSVTYRPDAHMAFTVIPHRPPPSLRAAALRLVLTQVHRIETLYLMDDKVVLERVFSPFKCTLLYAPALKKLSLLAPRAHAGFPELFELCDLPSLTNVELRDFDDPWHPPILQRNFTSLLLHQGLETHPPFSVSSLLSLLCLLPQLQTLHVLSTYCDWCNGGPNIPTDAMWPFPPVRLPHLQVLILHLSSPSLEVFLTHSHFPSSTKVRLETATEHIRRHAF